MGLWQIYPGPKITVLCWQKFYNSSLLSVNTIDPNQRKQIAVFESNLASLSLFWCQSHSMSCLLTLELRFSFRNWTLYTDLSKSNMQVSFCDTSTCIMQSISWFFFNLDSDIWAVYKVTGSCSFMNILHNVHEAVVLPVITFFKEPTYFLQYSMINDFILIICNTVARINAI